MLDDNNGMIVFNSMGGVKFYATYIPNKTSIKQIRNVLFDNYSCKGFHNDNISLMLEYNLQNGNIMEINLNKENEKSTLANVCDKYNIINDNTQPKVINLRYIHDYGKIIPTITDNIRNEINKNGMQIFIKTLNNDCFVIHVLPDMTIRMMKELIYEKTDLHVERQRLVYSGKALDDNRLIKEYNIKLSSTIHLVLSLRGGMYHETSGKNGNYNNLQSITFTIDADIV